MYHSPLLCQLSEKAMETDNKAKPLADNRQARKLKNTKGLQPGISSHKG